MKSLSKLLAFSCLLTLALAVPLAAGTDDELLLPEAQTVQAPDDTGDVAAPEDPELDLMFSAAGCTASYNCVHGTIVSCSSPLVGTCISSGARCGQVTCNGQTTKCPGYCYRDYHCYWFCMDQGSSDGYCDEFGCCVCL